MAILWTVLIACCWMLQLVVVSTVECDKRDVTRVFVCLWARVRVTMRNPAATQLQSKQEKT
jgi:hypothetical protein